MVTDGHDAWLRQIDAELDGELSLVERAALAKHLATCSHCAGARASQLEVRVALAQSAGDPHARVVPRPAIRGRILAVWMAVALAAGLGAGWLAHERWGGPGGSLEDVRAAIVVR
jgi:anti-sigma factor RsiW